MRYQQTKKITLVSAFSNALLAVIKIIVGLMSGSHALFADGIHSVSDLFTDFLILFASKYGEQAADEEHPYGHHRIETAATFFLSLLLVVTGCAILFDAYNHLFSINKVGDSYQVLSIVILSLIANELLFHYTMHHGKKLNSKLLIANAWHQRSDSLSSGVVLIGTIGSLYGINHSDPLAALFVGLLIIKMGWSIGWTSMQELIDKGIDLELVAKINHEIHGTSGVVAVHQLRTRSMAGHVLVDVHVLVESDLTVSEGHYIGQHVALNIRRAVEAVNDVTVHIDPEDDEVVNPSIDLPSRELLIEILKENLIGILEYEVVQKVNVHYIDGAINLELFVKNTNFDKSRCRAVIQSLKDIRDVQIYKSM